MNIDYGRITPQNLLPESLDFFDRTQEITRQWRKLEGRWQLIRRPFVDNWSLEKKREVARDLLDASERGEITYAAFRDGQVVGFVYVSYQSLQFRRPFRKTAESVSCISS